MSKATDQTYSELSELSSNESPIITSVIIHDVNPLFVDAYENCIEQFKISLIYQMGFKSLDVIRPIGDASRYIAIIRFDTVEAAQLWLDSKERLAILDEIKPWLINGDNYQTYIDPDFWFSPVVQTNMPKRWKQFILAWIGVLPWAITIPMLFIYLVQHYYPVPKVLMGIFISFIISWLMTYISMPFLTKKMAWWLIK